MRSTTLRWTVVVSCMFAAFIVALLGLVYLKTKNDLTMRSDRLIASRMGVFEAVCTENLIRVADVMESPMLAE